MFWIQPKFRIRKESFLKCRIRISGSGLGTVIFLLLRSSYRILYPQRWPLLGRIIATAKKYCFNHEKVNWIRKNADYESMSWLSPDRYNVHDVIWRGTYDFDVGKSISRAIWKGAMKIETFWALKWQRTKRVPFEPKKVPAPYKKTGTLLILCAWVLLQLYWYGWANPFRGPLEGVGPENLDIFVPKWQLVGPKKVRIFRAHPFQWPSKWISPHTNHSV